MSSGPVHWRKPVTHTRLRCDRLGFVIDSVGPLTVLKKKKEDGPLALGGSAPDETVNPRTSFLLDLLRCRVDTTCVFY